MLQELQQLGNVALTVVLADIDAFLDNAKCEWNVRVARCKYYTEILEKAFLCLDLKNVDILRSSDYQLEP